MKNLKYFIPVIGSLFSNNPYQSNSVKSYKPKRKEMLYDVYQIISAMGLIYLMSLLIK
jgi:hypothetical protein